MKATITSLAKYLAMSPQNLHYLKRTHPKRFNLLWDGWLIKVKQCTVKEA